MTNKVTKSWHELIRAYDEECTLLKDEELTSADIQDTSFDEIWFLGLLREIDQDRTFEALDNDLINLIYKQNNNYWHDLIIETIALIKASGAKAVTPDFIALYVAFRQINDARWKYIFTKEINREDPDLAESREFMAMTSAAYLLHNKIGSLFKIENENEPKEIITNLMVLYS